VRVPPLSETETTVVLLLVDDGLTIGRAGKRLGVAPSTVSTHLMRVKEKLGARTTGQALVFFDRRRRAANA
jgi:DNA-binding CsgD family transcriptional regulator